MSEPAQSGRVIRRKLRIEPAFHQIDMMGVVHNVQYFYWFEQGRLQVLFELMPFEDAMQLGIAMPVVRNTCLYKKAVRYGDPLVLCTTHALQERYEGRLVFTHSLVHEETKLEMASGESAVTIVDARTHQLLKDLPPALTERYAALR